jgi:F0F1-type ATP synthase delta subunit
MLDCTSVIESVGGFGSGLVSTPALLAAVLISCLTEFKVKNNLIASTCKVDDFPKQNTNVLSYIINENRFCFHQFLNILY